MAMFEQEIEMEKHQSAVVPLLLIAGLIVAVVGVAGYFLIQNHKVITTQEATDLAVAVLKAQGPATVHFHAGMVIAIVDEKPHDPHYRLLKKAGLIKLGQGRWGTATPVAIT